LIGKIDIAKGTKRVYNKRTNVYSYLPTEYIWTGGIDSCTPLKHCSKLLLDSAKERKFFRQKINEHLLIDKTSLHIAERTGLFYGKNGKISCFNDNLKQFQ